MKLTKTQELALRRWWEKHERRGYYYCRTESPYSCGHASDLWYAIRLTMSKRARPKKKKTPEQKAAELERQAQALAVFYIDNYTED